MTMTADHPTWKYVWHHAIAPLLSEDSLRALEKGLADNDPRLVQGATTVPPPLPSVQDWPVEAACALGYCGWQGEGLETVGEVEEFFARISFFIDEKLGEPSGCRYFYNWYDEGKRTDVLPELLLEVRLSLSTRLSNEAAQTS